MTGRPGILIDVDGVLNPRLRSPGYKRHRCSPFGTTYKLWLNAGHGRLLQELADECAGELFWATYWCGEANEWISPRLGLPVLPFVPIPQLPYGSGHSLGSWKVEHVADWARNKRRPFVWFEDEPDVAEGLAAQEGLADNLLIPVDQDTGLTEAHIATARTWLLPHSATF